MDDLLQLNRKIIHVDMDAFFASVEQRDNPDLGGKPIVVGGQPNSRGVVAAASYEARGFGIRSAMPCAKAQKLCPNLIFIPPRFQVYKRISNTIMGIMREFSDLVEPLSLDEAFIDVTQNKKHLAFATKTAATIRQRIFHVTGLTASAGVAPNKFLAKIASDMNKPNGMAVIRPHQVAGFIRNLEIRKVPGIGKVTEQKMKDLGIYHLSDLQQWTEEELVRKFGKSGLWYAQISKGIDDRPVQPHHERKSIGKETTFSVNIMEVEILKNTLLDLANQVSRHLNKNSKQAKTITLKITYADFTKITRSLTLNSFIDSATLIFETASQLLSQTEAGSRSIRLIGVSVSHFKIEECVENLQLTLW